jgi:hypothetical protein
MSPEEKLHGTSVRLSRAAERALDRLAMQRGISRSAVIREAVAAFVNNPTHAVAAPSAPGHQAVTFTMPDIPDQASESEKECVALRTQAAIAAVCPACFAACEVIESGPEMASVQSAPGASTVVAGVSLPRPRNERRLAQSTRLRSAPRVQIMTVIAHTPDCPAARED